MTRQLWILKVIHISRHRWLLAAPPPILLHILFVLFRPIMHIYRRLVQLVAHTEHEVFQRRIRVFFYNESQCSGHI